MFKALPAVAENDRDPDLSTVKGVMDECALTLTEMTESEQYTEQERTEMRAFGQELSALFTKYAGDEPTYNMGLVLALTEMHAKWAGALSFFVKNRVKRQTEAN